MKKNFIIAVLSIITSGSLIFGFSQKQKADQQEALAKEYLQKIKNDNRVRQELADKAQKELQQMRQEAKQNSQ